MMCGPAGSSDQSAREPDDEFNPNARLDTSQVQDRRGGGGGGLSSGGLGGIGIPGGKGGMAAGGGVLGLIAIVVIVLLNSFSGSDGGTSTGTGGLLQGAGGNTAIDNGQLAAECKTGADANTNGDCAVVAVINSVQNYWADALATSGTNYREADTVFFSGSTSTGCGSGSSGMGPFYCPADQLVYIDLTLLQRAARPSSARNGGLFVQAYVLAHEYGHHVQNLLGTERPGRHGEPGRRPARCGWSCRPTATPGCGPTTPRPRPTDSGQPLIQDITQEDMNNALDTARGSATTTSRPTSAGRRSTRHSSRHGTSAQRQQWFLTGYQSGNPGACDTFGTNDLG